MLWQGLRRSLLRPARASTKITSFQGAYHVPSGELSTVPDPSKGPHFSNHNAIIPGKHVKDAAARLNIGFPQAAKSLPMNEKFDFKRCGIAVKVSPQHLFKPSDMTRYLGPLEHPLTQWILKKYEAKTKTCPLWLRCMCITDHNLRAIVRSKAQRKMRYAMFAALAVRGYDREGRVLEKSPGSEDTLPREPDMPDGLERGLDATLPESAHEQRDLVGTIHVVIRKPLVVLDTRRSELDAMMLDVVNYALETRLEPPRETRKKQSGQRGQSSRPFKSKSQSLPRAQGQARMRR